MNDHSVSEAQQGVIQPATSGDIIYKAYSRPYAGGPSRVITVFASCSYGISSYKIMFQGDGANRFKLMEQPPHYFYNLVTYYTASYTPGIGTDDTPSTVTIIDAHGEHQVPVEPIV